MVVTLIVETNGHPYTAVPRVCYDCGRWIRKLPYVLKLARGRKGASHAYHESCARMRGVI